MFLNFGFPMDTPNTLAGNHFQVLHSEMGQTVVGFAAAHIVDYRVQESLAFILFDCIEEGESVLAHCSE